MAAKICLNNVAFCRIICYNSKNILTTRRVCLIGREIISFLKCTDINAFTPILNAASNTDPLPTNASRFKSFADYLKDNNDELTKSYFLYQDNAAYSELINEKGFFGITLSTGEKYLTKGEALTVTDGLTGEYVFDEKLIDKIYRLHTRICIPDNDLSQEVKKIASKECKEFLKQYGALI